MREGVMSITAAASQKLPRIKIQENSSKKFQGAQAYACDCLWITGETPVPPDPLIP